MRSYFSLNTTEQVLESTCDTTVVLFVLVIIIFNKTPQLNTVNYS